MGRPCNSLANDQKMAGFISLKAVVLIEAHFSSALPVIMSVTCSIKLIMTHM